MRNVLGKADKWVASVVTILYTPFMNVMWIRNISTNIMNNNMYKMSRKIRNQMSVNEE